MINFFFLYKNIFLLLIFASFLTFVATLIFIPLMIIRIPENYFVTPRAPTNLKWNIPSPIIIIFKILKNILGLSLFFLGLIMLFTPGQGLLSILIGLSLTNFPGKRRLERKIVSNKKVFKAINWIRKKSGVAPIKKPVLK